MFIRTLRRLTPVILILLLVLLSACARGKNSPKEDGASGSKSSGKAVEYSIVEAKSFDHKAATKPISFYSKEEFKALPLVKKMVYKVLVSLKIKENQVEPTVNKIIQDVSGRDKDIDEIEIFMFSDQKFLNSKYDVATAIWAPGGKLGNVTSETANSNDREGYEVRLTVREHLEEKLGRNGQFQLKETTQFSKDEEEGIEKILEYKEEQKKKKRD